MIVSTSIQDLAIISCFKCGSRISQIRGKQRTICPYCGSLFGNDDACPDSNRSRSVAGITLPKANVQAKKEVKSRFSWLGFKSKDPVKRGRDRLKVPHSIDCLPNLSPESRMTLTSGMSLSVSNIEESNPLNDEIQAPVNEFTKDIGVDNLKTIICEKLSKEDWSSLKDITISLFSNLRSVYFHFHKKQVNNEIHLDLADIVYNCMLEMSPQYQDEVINVIQKSLGMCTFKHFDEEIVALVVILLNSLLDRPCYYQVFLTLISMLISIHQRSDQQKVILTLIKLPKEKFKQILERVQNLLTYCLFSTKSKEYQKNKIIESWKQKSVQFITFLNAANNFNQLSKKILYSEFYNCSIDQENLEKDYDIWQSSPGNGLFTFCQYPCVLSINAKKLIIQKESEQQMVSVAKKSLVLKMRQREMPDFDMVFLNLSIRRKHLVSDSMNEILIKKHELKKKLKVNFIGEPGLDMGGLTKEWFLLVLRQILHAKASVFSNDEKSRINWFRSVPSPQDCKEFYLTGVLMGLAVYNSINLDVKFPLICYKKLLSPPIFMAGVKDPGICKVTLNDLKTVYPDLARGLYELLQYEGDVENDISATYEVFYEDYNGISKTHSLKPGGESICVNNTNRKEYVNLYCDFLLNQLIRSEFCAFYHGFHTVCESNALMLLKAEEVENLVCGNPVVNLSDLTKIVEYDGYTSTDITIILFWEILMDFSENLQKLFLHFTTGSDRVPVGGVQEMKFKISKANNKNMLPMAFTCFNQLILPAYTNKNNLKLKLLIAIENSEGFGLK